MATQRSFPRRTRRVVRRARKIEGYLKKRLAWARVYRATSYAKSALWIVPLIAIGLVFAFAPLLRAADSWIGWRSDLHVEGAQAMFQTVITLTLSFMVFTFGSLLVAIQVASGQLTPRIIATTLLRDNVVRYSVGLFVFTLVFAVTALDRLVNTVHQGVVVIGATLGVACMVAFLFLIDYAARLLRPVSVLARVGDEGLGVIESVYPEPAGTSDEGPVPAPRTLPPAPRVVFHTGASLIVLAVDLETLVAEAQRCDGIIEFLPQVGDFIAHEEPLFALYGGAAAIDDVTLRATVAFGVERTMEQDALFGFRILVDIALKALSPAINDPTTAVLALDQVHRLLRAVGKRHLQRDDVVDDTGRPRVIYRTPNWEDFVHIACREIRMCGASSLQVARRLRAMLDNLTASLPPYRAAALNEERDHLDRALVQIYSIAEDLALARIPDSQGLGASSAARLARRP